MIKTRYDLRSNRKKAVLISSYDLFYVKVERDNAQRAAAPGEIIFIDAIVEPVEPLTAPERFLLLVYEVRQLIRAYYDHGRRQEDLQASLAKEQTLDHWIARTRHYLDTHASNVHFPTETDKKSYSFFILVEQWRKTWHEYFSYKKQKDKDPQVESEIKKKSFDLERSIDAYIAQTLHL